jgi:two-component system sensor histidine kinase CpxA
MNIRLPLAGKILLCAAANFCLVAVALAIVVRVQLSSGLQSALLSPANARLNELGSNLAQAIGRSQKADLPDVLADFERRVPVRLGVYLNDGRFVAGSVNALPRAVRLEMTGDHVPPRGGPPKSLEGPPVGRFPGGRRHPVFFLHTSDPWGYWFGVRIPVLLAGQERPLVGTLMVFSASLFSNPYLFDARPWAACLLAMILCTLLCWAPLIRYLTKSLSGTRLAAERIAEGRFDQKVEHGRGDEIEHLSRALNRLALQLDGFVHGQKRFLGDIAHELTAPLARIQASAGLLEQRSSPAAMPYVERIETEIQQMSSLVNELLDFSRMGLQPDARPAVAQTVREAVEQAISREAAAPGAVQLLEGGELEVLAQPQSLVRALSNVVRNALRYAGAAGPITISAHRTAGQVEVVVADEGQGLPEEVLDRVFAPFYRVDHSRSRQSGGAGLGLAIVKACVESSGGAVSCGNRTPHGLEVRITLPAA